MQCNATVRDHGTTKFHEAREGGGGGGERCEVRVWAWVRVWVRVQGVAGARGEGCGGLQVRAGEGISGHLERRRRVLAITWHRWQWWHRW